MNFLIALLDASHTFHVRAHIWWKVNASFGWASCPLTENGVVRIMTTSAYSVSRPFRVPQVVDALRKFANATEHEFWADDLSLRNTDIFNPERILGTRQLTDLYLLALAVKHGGRLVTFDQGMTLTGVYGATAVHLCVV